MVITKIENQKKDKSRYSVFVDGYFAFGLSGTDVLFYKLKEGNEIDEKTFDYLLNEVEFIKAREAAVHYIGYQMRTEKEVCNKLIGNGYSDITVERVIGLVKQYNYINDYDFAVAYIKEKMRLKRFGKIRIQNELLKKGVSKPDIDSAYNFLSENTQEEFETQNLFDAEYENALKAFHKKYRNSDLSDYKEKRKAADFLLRRGFAADIVSEILKDDDKDDFAN